MPASSGGISVTVTAADRERLLAGLAGGGWVASGAPVAWFYDPPWTLPPLRRDEVAVTVARRG